MTLPQLSSRTRPDPFLFANSFDHRRCSQPAPGPLAELVRRSRREPGFRARLAYFPDVAARVSGIALDEDERAALREIGPTVFGNSDRELERLTRRRRHEQVDAAHEPVIEQLLGYRSHVADVTRDFLDSVTAPGLAPGRLRDLFRHSLDQGVGWALMAPCLPATDFPFAVAACVGDEMERAVPISVAGLLYYLGISMADDVIDHEVADNWGDTPSEHVTMAGIALFAGLPMRAMCHLYGDRLDSRGVCACHGLFQHACYQMSVGQYHDVAADFNDDTTLEQCHEIVALKTGSTGELMAGLTATLAGATPGTVEALSAAGKYLYMSMQIASDIHDIWGKSCSPDLGNGIVTAPTLFAYHASTGREQRDYRTKLRSDDWTESGQALMRKFITSTGALAYSLLQAETLRQRAIRLSGQCDVASTAADSVGRGLLAYMFDAAKIID